MVMGLLIFELLYFPIDAVKDPLFRTYRQLPHEEIPIKLWHFLVYQKRMQLLEQALDGHVMSISALTYSTR